MKIKTISAVILIIVLCALMIAFAWVGSNVTQKRVTENALSLVVMVLKDDAYVGIKTEIIKNLLSFAKLSDECKKGIVQTVYSKGEGLEELIRMLEYFEYNGKNISELEDLVITSGAKQAVKITNRMTAEDLAKKLIKDVYRGVTFEEQSGNGYLKRYFCSNLCIDVCENGKIRYLCDVTANSKEDLFIKWLHKNERIITVERIEKNGVIYEKFDGESLKGDLYINPENNRVIAAEITIKYDE